MNETSVHAEISLGAMSGGPQHAELIAFADACAARVARDVPGIGRWDLFVVAGLDGEATAMVRAHVGVATIEARASACDPAQAIWTAMCDVEQPLRDAATRVARSLVAQTAH